MNNAPLYCLMPPYKNKAGKYGPGFITAERMTFEKMLEGIKNGRWKGQVETVRKIVAAGGRGSTPHIDAKNRLDGITISVECPNRLGKKTDSEKFQRHTHRVQVDIDIHASGEELIDAKTRYGADPHFEWLAISPSGDGLKGAVLFEAEEEITLDNFGEWHQLAFEVVDKWLFDTFGRGNDPAVKDPYRLCYATYDPEPVITPEPLPFQITREAGYAALEDNRKRKEAAKQKAKEEEKAAKGALKVLESTTPPPADEKTAPKKAGRKSGVEKSLESWCLAIRGAVVGERHITLLKYARLAGGYIAGEGWDESTIVDALLEAANESAPERAEDNERAIRDGIEYGKGAAIERDSGSEDQLLRGLPASGLVPLEIEITDFEIREFAFGVETDDALLLNRVFGDQITYSLKRVEEKITDKAFFVYNGKIWEEAPNLHSNPHFNLMMAYIRKLCWNWYKDTDDAALKDALRKKVKYLKTVAGQRLLATKLEQYQTDRSEFETHDNLVVFQNCIVNLETGETMPHSPHYKQLLMINHDFNPEAKCPKFESFIETCFDESPTLIEFYWDIIGSGLSGEGVDRVYFAKGKSYKNENGWNGKSTAWGIPARLLGTYGGKSKADEVFAENDKSQQHIAKLEYKRIANLGELYGGLGNTFRKAVQTNELVHGYWNYHGPVSYYAKYTLFSSCNNAPEIANKVFADKRRMVFIPFNHHFDGSNGYNWTAEYLAEAEGILAKMVVHATKWFGKSVKIPPIIEKFTSKIWNENAKVESLERFIDESPRIERGATCTIEVGIFNAAYHNWFDAMKDHEAKDFVVVGMNKIKQRMEEMGFEQKRIKARGTVIRVYCGIALADEKQPTSQLTENYKNWDFA